VGCVLAACARGIIGCLTEQVDDVNLTVTYQSDNSQSHRQCHQSSSVMTSTASTGPKCYRLLTLIGITALMMMMVLE